MSITDAQIKAAIKTVTNELTLNDGSAGRGAGTLLLVVRRLSDGTTSAQWFAQVKRAGKRTKKAIGRYPEMTLAMARQHMAAEISPALQAGKALRVGNQGERPTIERMFMAYVDSMKAKGRESAGEVERMLLTANLDPAADVLGRNRLAAEVEASDVADYVARFIRRGVPGAADKARSYVSSAFNWAIKSANDPKVESRRNWGVKHNPAADVPRDPDAMKTIDRNLSAKEIRRLWFAATPSGDNFTLETAAVIRVMLATGQRVQETLRMDGAEIDLADASWNMPQHKTKMKLRPHSIPIPHHVLPVLAELKAVHGDGPLFPARAGAKGERISPNSIRHVVDRFLASEAGTGIAKFTPRDLRRTWKSRTSELDMDDAICDMIQQHAQTGTAKKHYNRADYLPKMRREIAKWEVWLDALLEPDQSDAAAA